MTSKEFIQANITWANNLLAQPSYTMPNGKPSHQVAYEVLGESIDQMVDECSVDAFGRWFV